MTSLINLASKTVIFALAMHTNMILGVSFDLANHGNVYAMEITQVHSKTDEEPKKIPIPLKQNTLTAEQLLERANTIERMSAEIKKLKKAVQNEKQHRWLHGTIAKEYHYARYRDTWRAQIELTANMIFKRNGISKYGKVLLDVAINPDGSLHSTRILRSSGNKTIDKAIKLIARISSPFQPLPPEILKDTDVLHIPMEWRFQKSGLATTSR
ncbi:MAG: TonB family protein [Gammaproteobacteria bacterium]|nr:TonB family protein [Gammaproteobacteria bacterium]